MGSSSIVNASQKRLFRRTRWRLAIWYAAILGVIFGLSGFVIYRIVVYAHQITLKEKLESVALALHETLEPLLLEPGQLEAATINFLPNVCLVEDECFQLTEEERQAAEAIIQDKYYIRLLAPSQKLIAIVGRQPKGLQITKSDGHWQDLIDDVGADYHQISLELRISDSQEWGSIQVGQSL
ncbi:MAG: two-component sensor histidine kinase, partial [Pseudanabaenales cyanobacterium]|nr:two-component sensor histidine kinase [Pseudanabaenales cyanobacterium]